MSTGVCPPYSITDGSYTNCGPLILCPGNTITVDGCGACTGDQELGLTFNFMTVSQDNGCGDDSLCAKFTYTVPESTTSCQQTYIKEYCNPDTTTCGGTVSYEIIQSSPSTMYVDFYDNTTCASGSFGGSMINKMECSPIGDSGLFTKVGCTGILDTSPWTAFIYSDSTCTIAYNAAIVGADSCDCQPLTAANVTNSPYSMRVNCASTPPACGAEPVSDDTGSPPTDDIQSPSTDDATSSPQNAGGSDSVPTIDGSSGLFIGVVVSAGVVLLVFLATVVAFCSGRKRKGALSESEVDQSPALPAV